MENPATWNETQKIIHNALYESVLSVAGQQTAMNRALNVYRVLHEKGFINNTHTLTKEEIEKTIADAITAHEKAVEQRMCGSSLSSNVYQALFAQKLLV